jgi:adenylate cyclase
MTVALFGQGYWFSIVLPLAGVVPPAAVAMVIRQVFDRRRAREVARAEASLRQFQAPVLAERIARDPDFLRVPVTQAAAILFIDLSGFTRLSEQVGLTQTRNFLNQFHSLVADKSIAQGGLVMSFMGDGAMIAFGVPDAHSDDAGRALTAAWGLLKDVRDWIVQAGVPSRSNSVRLGGHCGPVVVSRLGHEMHQHITVTGDTVNVASRMMEVARAHGATLAVTAELFSAVGDVKQHHREPDEIREVEIRGRRQHVTAVLWRA